MLKISISTSMSDDDFGTSIGVKNIAAPWTIPYPGSSMLYTYLLYSKYGNFVLIFQFVLFL